MAANVDQQHAAVIENPEDDAVCIGNRKCIIVTEHAFQLMGTQSLVKDILSEYFEPFSELVAIWIV